MLDFESSLDNDAPTIGKLYTQTAACRP